MVNVDVCKHKNGELWVPRTSAEHHFVTQTFQSPNNLYHLGVVKYMVCISMYIVSIVVVYYDVVSLGILYRKIFIEFRRTARNR